LSTRSESRELVPLVDSFNHALDRLEEAYRRLEGFSADVAHELRTPLAILINGTEVALSRDRPGSELQELLISHLEDLRALASMVNDMLFLARAERGELAENLVMVSLRSEALVVADYLEASMEDRGNSLRVDGDVQARVNPPLLRRALVNLVTNAARYTPTGEVIVVRLDAGDGSPRVSVSNPSPPIPKDTLLRMFDRFWRSDAARAQSSEGHGLGLAIVRAVALMHGGEPFAVSSSGMTTVGFTVTRG
jgi:two-component system, OmpR family, heavy metal sensor histidine kinase CusS